ncbi:MAG: aminodeoxychorismate synthase, component I [Acidimicrobiaceae bacterium]|nr:aminodeoxychorismate synthase, component I [Acidimicrobiaceae bacterium]MYG54227.1 aminodeoxychorismate synthase, component I [Acidimicrobiaceae bacterium]MYJ97597.1 aminodeoxychorismate synthase, component I [Acidimicrobiaceae bacterium]
MSDDFEISDSEPLRLHRALVRHDSDQGRRWLEFRNPVAHFLAANLSDVGPTIDAVEAAAAQGLWLVGIISYDAAPAFDEALSSLRDPTVPLAAFAAFGEPNPSRGPAGRAFTTREWTPSADQQTFESAVESIRELIAAGDTYQVNHTLRLHSDFSGDPEGLFAALCRAQRADHLAFLDFGAVAVCSASPEQLISRRDTSVVTRPMKGTRPRHPDPMIDRDLANELVRSEKDRAENTMIVDMARNDLGRVAEIGTVRVAKLHTVESYPTVHQLTSTVTAETNASLRDLLAATFPGASITGAPKVAASRVIAELEGEPRGIYTGSVGVVEPGGNAEFNIAIRTAWIDQRSGKAVYGVGGGIVWDSEPTAEWHEAHDKARVLHRATRPFRLLETLAWEPGAGPILLDRHLVRLTACAEHFGFDMDPGEVRRRLDAIRAEATQRVRILVSADGAIEVQVAEMSPPAANPEWHIALDTLPVSSNDEFLRFKTTRRDRYDQALARHPDADDVLLWNERGELTETTIANLVLEIDGNAVTPAESSGLLPGTLRAELLANRRIQEATVTIEDLDRADSVWLINSVRGWIPARVLDRSSVPVVGGE